MIARLVAETSAPRRLIVVTSDRDLAIVASRRGCTVISAHDFLTHLAADLQRRFKAGRRRRGPRKPQPPLSPAEVDYWLAVFGLADRESAGIFSGVTAPPDPTQAEIDAIDMKRVLEESDVEDAGGREADDRA